jgi:chromosome segregation ATPase
MASMEMSAVPPALRERLGAEATTGLLALFTAARQEWTTEVTTAAVERFERRLSEELSDVRREFRSELAGVRVEFRSELSGLRQELGGLRHEFGVLRQEFSGLRQEFGGLHDELTELRHELHGGLAGLRQDHLTSRFTLVKWCFAFWVGQAIAVAGIVGVMLRVLQP